MRKLQSQGVHHITIVGGHRQTSIDFWEGVLGMPFVFEQPNLDIHRRATCTSTRATDG
jgi:catechol 2,3-dioxygenase-like lactoylglutathione lyase family enzyme